MKFQAKLYVFFALTVILPICVATAVLALLFSRISTDEANDRLINSAAVIKAYIQASNISLTNDLASKLANQPSLAVALSTRDSAEASQSLASIAQQLGAYQVSLYTMDGALLTQSGPVDPGAVCLASARVPITQGGTAIGTVVATRQYDNAFLNNTLAEAGLPATVNCGGQLQANTFPENETPPSEIPALDSAGKVSDVSQVGSNDYFLYRYVSDNGSYAPALVFTMGFPAGSVEDRRTIILETGASMIIFTILVAALLGYMMTRSITNPLRLLTQAVLKAEAGDLNTSVSIDSHDEIGVLARNFNRMIRQISRFIDQMRQAQQRLLKAFGYAGDLLTSGYDRELLVKSVTDTVAFATSASATAFYLMQEDEDGRRRLLPARRSPEDFFTDERLRTISGTLRQVEKGCILGIISQPLDDDHQFMVSPVALQENMFGALVAIVESSGEADKSSSRVLESLANQAATALENIRLNEVLQEMVITDSLTGLFNVRHFNDTLTGQIETSRRYGHELSLLVIDLDDFKKVNDTYGHPVGDEVLRQVGQLFKETIRKTDIAARYGGEEFAIILPHTSKSTAFDVAEKVRLAAEKRKIKDYPEIRIRFSVGVASYPGDADSPLELTKVADDATYQAKKQGKNRTVAA